MSNAIGIAYYHSPIGELILGEFKNQLVLCDWRYRKMRDAIDHRVQHQLAANFVEEVTAIVEQTMAQLHNYFAGNLTQFTIPVNPVGTPFQKRVWAELLNIPFGQTQSYLQLSKQLGDEKAVRAVAAANGANALSILIPCHRIIGSNGNLVGYAGGLAAKKKLLALEGVLNSNQLDLF